MTLATFRRNALIDSSAFLALLDSKDSNYASAIAIQRRLIAERWRTYTTNFIVAEAHALILSRLKRFFAREFLGRIDGALATSSLVVVRVAPEDEVVARQVLERYLDKDFSFTDTLSFSVMHRVGIPTAFTFDSDFRQYGLDVMTPDG